jgi:hypothetical protein
MYREIWIGVVTAGLVCAQSPAVPSGLTILRQNIDEKTMSWLKLTQNLDAKIAGLLPCDPKIATSLREVSKASDARLDAVSEYLRAAVDRAAATSTAASQLLEGSASKKFAEMERIETTQERAAIDGQMSQLVASSIVRRELSASEAALREIATQVDARNSLLARQISQEGARQESLANYVDQLKVREEKLKEAASAYQAEADQWKSYYAARLDRAKAECDATAPASVRRRPLTTKGTTAVKK